MITALVAIVLCMLGIAALRGLASGIALLLRGLFQLAGAALLAAAFWALLQLLA